MHFYAIFYTDTELKFGTINCTAVMSNVNSSKSYLFT